MRSRLSSKVSCEEEGSRPVNIRKTMLAPTRVRPLTISEMPKAVILTTLKPHLRPVSRSPQKQTGRECYQGQRADKLIEGTLNMLTQKEVRENAGISQHADLVRGLTPACAAWRALTMSDATIFSP